MSVHDEDERDDAESGDDEQDESPEHQMPPPDEDKDHIDDLLKQAGEMAEGGIKGENDERAKPKDREIQSVMREAAQRPAAPRFIRVSTVEGFRVEASEAGLRLVAESDNVDIFLDLSAQKLDELTRLLKGIDGKSKGEAVMHVVRFPKPKATQVEMSLGGSAPNA